MSCGKISYARAYIQKLWTKICQNSVKLNPVTDIKHPHHPTPPSKERLDEQESIVGTLLNAQTLPACEEDDWTTAKVQINNSSLHSLRKISVQCELNFWQQQILLRKKNRRLLEQILQLKNPEALLKARQAKHHYAAANSTEELKTISKKYTNIIS